MSSLVNLALPAEVAPTLLLSLRIPALRDEAISRLNFEIASLEDLPTGLGRLVRNDMSGVVQALRAGRNGNLYM